MATPFASGAGSADEEEIPALLPPRGEIPAGFWEQNGLYVAAGGVLLAGLLSASVWWLTRPRPPRLVSAATEAYQALQPLAQQPETDLVLSRVSQIVRAYFGAVFRLPRGELTTAEFSQAIARVEEAGPELAGDAIKLLRGWDERKFAPAPATAPAGAVSAALQLIERAEARRALLAQSAVPAPKPDPAGKSAAAGAAGSP